MVHGGIYIGVLSQGHHQIFGVPVPAVTCVGAMESLMTIEP